MERQEDDHAGKSRIAGRDFVFDGATTDFADLSTPNLLDRHSPLTDWFNARAAAGVDPYCRVTTHRIGPDVEALQRNGTRTAGVNFGSQDYLNLASAPQVVGAAHAAAEKWGVHSAGSASLMGLTGLTTELEARVAAFLGLKDATVFPTGWGAGYGVIKTLVTPRDHVVIDLLAHACLQEGARNATGNIHTFPHLSTDAVKRRLARIRRDAPSAGILVVSETVFSMDSDVPDVAALQQICREHGATLLVDVAHDLGAIGETGRGYLEIQGIVGKVDIVMGSFSKTFASNGGFVASNHPALKLALRSGCGPLTFTNSMSPIQAAVVLKCFDIVESAEGAQRRERLMDNILYMREQLETHEFRIPGQPSAIIPVFLGDNATSRLMTRYALENGAVVNLVEYPAVSRNTCRWRVQVMADHTKQHIDKFVQIAVAARANVEKARGKSQRPSEPAMSTPENADLLE